LGRHVEHDDRSRDFRYQAARQAQADKLWGFSKPVLNQWDTNSCVTNTVMQFFNTDFATAFRNGHHVSWYTEGQALDAYHLATVADGISTDIYPPNDNGTTALGGAKAAQELGLIDRYEHTFDFESFCAALQNQPVCVGTVWTNSMFDPDPTGHLTVGPVDDSTIAGGHEYLALGINYTNELLTFLTSWGASFARHGQFTVSFTDFEALLNAEGDVLVLHPKGM
jgi:hypothetical protein